MTIFYTCLAVLFFWLAYEGARLEPLNFLYVATLLFLAKWSMGNGFLSVFG